jgi:hypothetical protein
LNVGNNIFNPVGVGDRYVPYPRFHRGLFALKPFGLLAIGISTAMEIAAASGLFYGLLMLQFFGLVLSWLSLKTGIL